MARMDGALGMIGLAVVMVGTFVLLGCSRTLMTPPSNQEIYGLVLPPPSQQLPDSIEAQPCSPRALLVHFAGF